MLNLKFLPIHFSIFLIIGILLGYLFDFSLTNIALFGSLNFAFLIFFYFKAKASFQLPKYFVIFTAISFLLMGILSVLIQKNSHQKKHYINHLGSNNTFVLRINKVLKPNTFYYRFEAEIIQTNKTPTKGTVLLTIKRDSLLKNFSVDALLVTTKPCQEIRKNRNPYEFNYQDYLKKQQIQHQIILYKADFSPLNLTTKTPKGIASSLRKKINKALKKYKFATDELAIINALLLGQRQDVSKDLFEQYKNAGAVHILAVSGLHIGIVLLLLSILSSPLKYFKNGKIIQLLFLIIALWLYAFIAGFSASIVRATTMFTAIALATNKQFGVKNSLVISLFILLLIHPLYLFDVGFQLSYIAVFSIVWLQPFFVKMWRPKHKIVHYFWQLLTVSFAAQLGVLPLSLFYFHQFPGLFFISSLVIIPFLGIILGLGFLVILLAFVDFLPLFLANFYGFLIKAMNTFVAIISQQESFLFQNISFSFLQLLFLYLFLIGVFNYLKKKKLNTLYIVLFSVIFFQITVLYKKHTLLKSSEFIVFHQSKKSIFGDRKGKECTIYSTKNFSQKQPYNPITSYKIGVPNMHIQNKKTIPNVLKIQSKKVLIIDSLGIYKNLIFKPDIIILVQSPKINLDRLIQKIHPEIIIADGSNYKSYAKRWEKSCKTKSVTFHNTSKNGAFVSVYSP